MARPRIRVKLFPKQWDVIKHKAPELLIGGDGGRGGSSHALRAAGIILATRGKDLRIALVQRNSADLRRNHLEGPQSLQSMLQPLQLANTVEVQPGEARFSNGSRLTWAPCARDVEAARLLEQRIDVLLVDDVDQLSEDLYTRLSAKALDSTAPVHRVIAATSSRSSGWVGNHWNGHDAPGREVLEITAADLLDPSLAEQAAPRTFRAYVDASRPGLHWYRHVEVIASAIQRQQDGQLENLFVFVPAQHGKTELAARLSTGYFLERNPGSWAAITSYSSDRANARSYDARNYYQRSGGELMHGAASVNEWRNVYGGGIWSAGIGAGQAGQPMTYGVVDDADFSLEDALGSRRLGKQRWYLETWRHRESLFGDAPLRQMGIATRWHELDTSAFILRKAAEVGERWHIIVLPALYDPEVAKQFTDEETIAGVWGKECVEGILEHFTVEPDWRTEVGEPICPEQWDRAYWDKRQRLVGADIFEAEDQQNPKPEKGGGIFDRKYIGILHESPPVEAIYQTCRAWDDGATEDGGDATASVRMHLLEDGTELLGEKVDEALVIDHLTEDHVDGADVQDLKLQWLRFDGPDVVISTPQDPGAAGKRVFLDDERVLQAAGAEVLLAATNKNKKMRARPLASASKPPKIGGERVGKHGRLFIVVDAAGMVGEVPIAHFLDLLHNFRGVDGEIDDLVDAAGDAKVGAESDEFGGGPMVQ